MVEFKKFKVSELFDYKRGKESAPKKVPEGDIPLISETSSNNGFVRGASSTHVFPAKTITVSVNYAQTVFLQPKEFCASANIIVLIPKFSNVSDAVLLYFVALLRANNGVYDYNYKISKDRLMNTVLLVPVVSDGTPDFEYMTMRIRELEAQRIRELEAYLRVTGLNDTTLSTSEVQALTQKVKLKKFRIGDLFDYRRGKESAPKKVPKGDIPLISETSSNNGFVRGASSTHVFPAKTITVSVNYAQTVFLQLKEFCASANIIILVPKFDNVPNAALLYFVALLRANNGVYDYNYKISKDRLMNTVLLVPVTSTGAIDFDYMQNYIRATEKQTIKGVVEYKDRVIAETKKVVGE